jgi:hypothetical protein
MTEFYIAMCRGCGAVTGCCVDKPEYAEETAKDIQTWVKDGRKVEHIETEVMVKMGHCKCKKAV